MKSEFEKDMAKTFSPILILNIQSTNNFFSVNSISECIDPMMDSSTFSIHAQQVGSGTDPLL